MALIKNNFDLICPVKMKTMTILTSIHYLHLLFKNVVLLWRVMALVNLSSPVSRGFSMTTVGRTHIFKPVSVQAMWWENKVNN